MNGAKYREILDKNLLQSAQDRRLGRRFTFQQDYDPTHTATTTQEGRQDTSLTVLEWPSQRPHLNPIEHLWSELKRHPSHRLFFLLPHGKRYRSAKSRSKRLLNCFFPEAIRLPNN